MKRLALLTVLVLSPVICNAWTLQWGASATYTDGSPISRPVTYTVWDNAAGPSPLATGIVATSFPLTGVGSGIVHRYEIAAVVDNVLSARTGVSWTSPFQVPVAPGAPAVVP